MTCRAIVVTSLAFFFATAVTQASTSVFRYGIVTSVFDADQQSAVAELGAGAVRLNFYWKDIEPTIGNYDFSSADRWVNNASGRTILASISRPPSWAAPCETCMVYNINDWSAFVASVMSHYSSNSNLVLGIWNEPNLEGLSTSDYESLFYVAATNRNQYYPGVRLAGPETSSGATSYFNTVTPWIRQYMTSQDVVTLHWYFDGPSDLAGYMNNAISLAQGREVWLSEVGYSTCDDSDQRTALNSLLDKFYPFANSRWTTTFWYVLHTGGSCDETITRGDWSRRPAFYAYQDRISRETSPDSGDTLGPNQELDADQSLISSDGDYQLIYQSDGNLVAYQIATGSVVWASNTAGTTPGRAIMQGDGNFVIYDGNGAAVYSSGTWGHPGAFFYFATLGRLQVWDGTSLIWWR